MKVWAFAACLAACLASCAALARPQPRIAVSPLEDTLEDVSVDGKGGGGPDPNTAASHQQGVSNDSTDRQKRSGNLLSLFGGGSGGSGGFLSNIFSSSSSNHQPLQPVEPGQGTYSSYANQPAVTLPSSYNQKSFDLGSFKRSLFGVLMQAVRAITGGVIALKGQLVKVKGRLVTAQGNIISASGDAISQFGRNVATNALMKPQPAPAPKPVYGPPPKPIYGPPVSLPPPKPIYGLPAQPPPRPAPFEIPAPPPPSHPVFSMQTLKPPPQSYNTLDNYGPPHSAPVSNYGAPDTSYGPPDNGFAVPGNSYGPPPASDIGYGLPDSIYQNTNSFKRNVGQSSTLNSLQGAHAGLLILKPAPAVPLEQAAQYSTNNKQQQKTTETGSDQQSTAPDYGARISNQSNNNERIFSLLFGSKKPAKLRPHPVTRALPPQVVAAASAQLAAKLDLAGRAPPRTAVAVSGPSGKFIMYS